MTRRQVLVAALAVHCMAAPAAAHPLAPSLFEVREREGGRIEVTWKASLLQPRGSDLRPQFPPHCEPLGVPEVLQGATSATLRWSEDCGPRGLIGERLRINGLDRSRTAALVRVELLDGRLLQAVLSGADASLLVTARPDPIRVAQGYCGLGLEHILGGIDHLLFVLGLVLLVVGRRALAYTVTAFTLGHSVTLSLAVLGFVDFPTRWVELAIAASILLLAAELGRADAPAPSRLRRRPWELAFVFGLLHGLGFAGALTEVGLPAGEIPIALLSFNLGIEIGQLLFVAVVLAVAALRSAFARGPQWLSQLPAYAIGILASFWCFERFSAIVR
ncbi:MAG: HupE/UreJ family protein [Myxococcota bacterium]